jgi:hypothetical protein
MRNENIPVTPSPERPAQAPHDVPDPGPQAAAWRRAIRVVSPAVITAIGAVHRADSRGAAAHGPQTQHSG